MSPLRRSLAPAFLLSMPQLTDPNFNRTVVLLCKHNDEGAFGLVVNRPLVTSGRVVVNLEPPVETDSELEVWVGGPVEPQSSWMLVGDDLEDAPGLGGHARSSRACASRPHASACAACSNPIRLLARVSSSATQAGGPDSWKPSSRNQRGC